MKKTLTAVALALAALLQPVSARQDQAPVWLQRLERWLQAIERHQPGANDEEARAIGPWSRSDLRMTQADLLTLRDLLKRASADGDSARGSRGVFYRERTFTVQALQQMFGVSDEEARDGDLNRLLWAGAVLHSDIAMVVPSDDRPTIGRSMRVRVEDGQADGYEYPVAEQWDYARDLLASLKRDPRGDEMVNAWYRATASHQLVSGELSDATEHLNHGLQLFPGDAHLLFLAGCVHEAYAAPSFQQVAASLALPPGQTLRVGSRRSHLEQAESSFAKALDRDGSLVEARLRLGRVLGLLGRHEEAADHLRKAAGTVGDSQVVYYACMFLGDEERALGHREAARGWYERAANIYPRAQSPLFALSDLASQGGDTGEARRAAGRIRALPGDEDERFDPWLVYYTAGGRDAATLWGNVLAATRPGVKR